MGGQAFRIPAGFDNKVAAAIRDVPEGKHAGWVDNPDGDLHEAVSAGWKAGFTAAVQWATRLTPKTAEARQYLDIIKSPKSSVVDRLFALQSMTHLKLTQNFDVSPYDLAAKLKWGQVFRDATTMVQVEANVMQGLAAVAWAHKGMSNWEE